MVFNRIIYKIKDILKNANMIHASADIGAEVKIKGSSVAASVSIGSNSVIRFSNLNGVVAIGTDSFLEEVSTSGRFITGPNCRLYKASIQGNVVLGRYSSLWGPNLDIVTGNQKVIIGSFCSVARNVTMQTFNHNHKKVTSYFMGQNFFNEKWENERVSNGDIVIQNDVWIGSHCVLLGGVTVHNGAVVAANSVVTKDVPAYSIVAGSPARVIGFRFDEDTIEKLQVLQWWDWSEEKVKANKALFDNDNFNLSSLL